MYTCSLHVLYEHMYMNVHRYVVHVYIHTCVHTYLITNTCNPKTNLHTTYYVCTHDICAHVPPVACWNRVNQAIIVVCMVCRLEFSFLFLILQIIADFANYWWYWQLAVLESRLLLFKMSVKVSSYYYKYSTCKMGTTCIPVSNGCCFFVQNFFYSVPPVYPGTTVEDSVQNSTVERS